MVHSRAGPAAFAAVATLALLAGCVQPPADVVVPAYVAPTVPAVDAAALLADHAAFVTQFPVREENHPDHAAARDALEATFRSYGLDVYRHKFTEGSLDQENIVGIKWGQVRDQWVVVGGHYDTTTNLGADNELSQGAYDDGSGTFITVHLAKAFSQVDPYYTIAFVAYDGEERGLKGASAFVHDFHVEGSTSLGLVTVVGAIDLDMVGINWPGVQAPMNILANSDALGAAADAKRRAMGWPDEQWKQKDSLAAGGMVELGSSDYAAFMRQSEPAIPTIFFISDFLEVGAPAPAPALAYTPVGAYPFWHVADTVETMNAMAGTPENLEAGFQSISDVAAELVWQLACQPQLEWDARPMAG